MTCEQATQIKRLAETGLQTHEIHSRHFPNLDLWEVHNVIHFDGKCQSKKDLIDSILKLHPDLAKTFVRLHRRADRELTLVIFHHEGAIIESKLRASEAHRNKNSSNSSCAD
ncbi:MAG TPA: hypothetical protein VN281_03610 [Verrucomicrobiae bacterium]|jgi:hypothetical protein|nr:hypothetical protein [Verrucomicrobiae bacterium]